MTNRIETDKGGSDYLACKDMILHETEYKIIKQITSDHVFLYRADIKRIHVCAIMKILQGVMTMIPEILLAEDDEQIREAMTDFFLDKGADVLHLTTAADGAEALDLIRAKHFDLLILDVMMPNIDGFTLCRQIRAHSDVLILFLTARAREEDVLYGYSLGCDDYIVKPFLLSALYAKCAAFVKRTEGIPDHILTCGAIRLDLRKLTCFVHETEVELTPKGFAILRYLMEHPGWVVSRDTLLDHVWGADYFGLDRTVDNHIKRLRKALGSAGGQIHTVVGRGYKLTET